jgi:hypothetical protein
MRRSFFSPHARSFLSAGVASLPDDVVARDRVIGEGVHVIPSMRAMTAVTPGLYERMMTRSLRSELDR